ncbi:uroporphyrinogen-III synthase [Aquisalimonas sp.]|uniref:uroporphyrinogen-III synthase n=1 Tax=Aquisalimonas sp. TaxID=1872621 RepID=UPI0025C63182|nr:uroporphyrinogen-III synthase [Aquisalimonas sp.]
MLVTRPVHQAAPLCEALECQGAAVTRFPVIAIRPPLDEQALDRGVKRLHGADVAIFVSPNAVEALLDRLAQRGIPWPEEVRVAAVGRGTQRALEQRGVGVDTVPDSGFDSESLLSQPALQHVCGQHAMLVRGDGGRDVLRATLEHRGATVEILAAYRRALPELDPDILDEAWANGRLDVAVITSATALEHLMRLVGPTRQDRLLATGLVVISERVAEQASGLGFHNGIVIAAGPSTEALTDGVVRWVASNRRQDNP